LLALLCSALLLQSCCCSSTAAARYHVDHPSAHGVTLLHLNRKLLETIVDKEKSSAKVNGDHVKVKGDTEAFEGEGTSSSKITSKTKLNIDPHTGEGTLTTVTRGSSYSSEGGTAGTIASAATGLSGGNVAGSLVELWDPNTVAVQAYMLLAQLNLVSLSCALVKSIPSAFSVADTCCLD
jgi:hypothetical protein